MSTMFLKVKVASLAAEARIIRNLERNLRRKDTKVKENGKVPDPRRRELRLNLADHRRMDIRKESRCSHLAYGFLRGRAYQVMEEKCHTSPDWKRVQQLIEKYAVDDKRIVVQRFSEWKAGGSSLQPAQAA